MCLSIEWKLYTFRNSNREQLRKFINYKVLRQESNLPEDLVVDEFFLTVPG